MKEMIQEFIQYKELLGALTYQNIRIRYKQTIMGFLWALFMPIVIVCSGVMVKKAMATLSGAPLKFTEIASVSVKALPWAFFIGAIRFAVNSLIGNINLVQKIYFPREMLPLSYVLAQLFDFIVASCVLIVILTFAKIGISIYLFWLPLLILFLVFFTTGLCLILACGNLFFRDVKYIVDVILTFGIFFTPVFFDASMFGKWEQVMLLNPMGAILENINTVVVLHRAPDFFWLTYAGLWAIFGFFISWYIFHKSETTFAENI